MADIKTRDAVKGTIKTIDKAAIASERMKSAYVGIKEKAEQGYYADENSATEYAADRISFAADRAKDEGVHQFNKQGQKAVKTTQENIGKAKDKITDFKQSRAVKAAEQKAAQNMVEFYDGEMPADYEKLLGLPGIGPYTAGAVASIAFELPVPAVDGNVLRVITRITQNDGDILKQSVKRQVEEELLAVMPKGRSGAFNQALMELGATVCVPNGAPKCEECPLSGVCLAHQNGKEMDYPKKAQKKPRKIEKKTVLVIRDGSRAAIRKRPAKGLLAGLYELPNLSGWLSQDEVLDWLKQEGLSPIRIRRLSDAKHIFSHIEWHMTGYVVLVEELENDSGKDMLFIEPKRTEEEYPIPAAFSAYTAYLQIRLGQEKYDEK